MQFYFFQLASCSHCQAELDKYTIAISKLFFPIFTKGKPEKEK